MTYRVEVTQFAVADAEAAYVYGGERSVVVAAEWYNGLPDIINLLEKLLYRWTTQASRK